MGNEALPSLLVVMLIMMEAGSDWLKADTAFSAWMVNRYLVCGRSPKIRTRVCVRPDWAGRNRMLSPQGEQDG